MKARAASLKTCAAGSGLRLVLNLPVFVLDTGRACPGPEAGPHLRPGRLECGFSSSCPRPSCFGPDGRSSNAPGLLASFTAASRCSPLTSRWARCGLRRQPRATFARGWFPAGFRDDGRDGVRRLLRSGRRHHGAGPAWPGAGVAGAGGRPEVPSAPCSNGVEDARSWLGAVAKMRKSRWSGQGRGSDCGSVPATAFRWMASVGWQRRRGQVDGHGRVHAHREDTPGQGYRRNRQWHRSARHPRGGGRRRHNARAYRCHGFARPSAAARHPAHGRHRAGYFVPGGAVRRSIVFCGLAVWGPPPALFSELIAAVSVLIIACPCALGLATPMSIASVSAGRRCWRAHQLSQSLERMEKVNTLVVDKTGTLTEGKPKVIAMSRRPACVESRPCG